MSSPTHPVQDLLEAGAAVHRAMYAELERRVAAQRLAGASWSAVGRELGVTKQSAHRRWRHVDIFPRGVAVHRAGYFSDPATGAVIGTEQVDQVRRHGRILDHHPLNAIGAGL